MTSSAVIDFETQSTYKLTINVTDNGLPPLTLLKAIYVTVTNFNEVPKALTLDNNKVQY